MWRVASLARFNDSRYVLRVLRHVPPAGVPEESGSMLRESLDEGERTLGDNEESKDKKMRGELAARRRADPRSSASSPSSRSPRMIQIRVTSRYVARNDCGCGTSSEAVAFEFPVEAHSRVTHGTRARSALVRECVRSLDALVSTRSSKDSRGVARIVGSRRLWLGTRRNSRPRLETRDSRGTHWNSPETDRSRRVSWRPWSPGWRGPTASRRRASRRTGTSASFSGGCCRGTGTERQDNLTNYSLAIGLTIHRERSRMIRATNQRIGSDRRSADANQFTPTITRCSARRDCQRATTDRVR